MPVSIPCPTCDAPIRYGVSRCPECASSIPADARRALEERLEATDADYRELKRQQGAAATVLLVLALLQLAITAFAYVMTRSPDAPQGLPEVAIMEVALLFDGLLGVSFLACFFWARRSPVTGIGLAFGLWLLVSGAAVVLNPLNLFRHGVANLLVLLLLGRGFVAATQPRDARLRMIGAHRP